MNDRIEIIKNAIAQKCPIDIYFRINDGEGMRCKLVYPAFIPTKILENGTDFEGYEIQERSKSNIGKKITTVSIYPICNIISDHLDLDYFTSHL